MKYDIFYFFLFLLQVSFLPSVPSGFHSQNNEGWVGFSFTILFYSIFYPLIYFKFYKNSSDYIREMVILSVVARFNAFFLVGIISLTQMFIWSLLGISKSPYISFIYYVSFYTVFAFLMFSMKSRLIVDGRKTNE